MPRFDATGPRGEGRMTGRGMGPCRDIRAEDQQNVTVPADQNTLRTNTEMFRGMGRGFRGMCPRGFRQGWGARNAGMGRGFGRGQGRMAGRRNLD